MVFVLCDTSVWLNLAKDPQQNIILQRLRSLVASRKITLLVPRVVIEEFLRNKDDIVSYLARRNQVLLREVRELVKAFGDTGKKEVATDQITAVANKMPSLGTSMAMAYTQIQSLFDDSSTVIIELSDAVKSSVVDMALLKRAPFHRNKNSLADAIIIQTFWQFVESEQRPGGEFLFVTANTDDFSEPNADANNPHSDFLPVFGRTNSHFFINAGKAVNFIEENLVPPDVVDHLERIRSIKPPTCHFCGGHSLMPAGAVGRDWTGETFYFLICRECSQMTDVREAWGES